MSKHVGRKVLGIISPGVIGVQQCELEVVGSVPVTSATVDFEGRTESLLLLRHDNGHGKWCFAVATVKDLILDDDPGCPQIGLLLPLDVTMEAVPPKEISARLRALADVVDQLNEV